MREALQLRIDRMKILLIPKELRIYLQCLGLLSFLDNDNIRKFKIIYLKYFKLLLLLLLSIID